MSGDATRDGMLIDDLAAATDEVVAVLSDLRHAAFGDLAVAVAETRACRQLAGIPV